MPTVIYIHGIGNRGPNCEDTRIIIKNELAKKANVAYKVIACDWGDLHGARLPRISKSIPGLNVEDFGSMEAHLAIWEALSVDPLAQLMEMSHADLGPPPPTVAPSFKEAIDAFFVRCSQDCIASGAIHQVKELSLSGLREAHERLLAVTVYQEACTRPATDLTIAIVLSRTMMSVALRRAGTAWQEPAYEVWEVTAKTFAQQFIRAEKAFGSSILWPMVTTFGTRLLRGYRRQLTERLAPLIGDVLTYQTNGERLRDQIKNMVAQENNRPLILFGHSLGGVAAVDFLCTEHVRDLAPLITVGSQAGFFYELGILKHCPRGTSLPDHFPPWINFYDLNDFLSFLAKPVFQSTKIEDKELKSNKPFPESHSSYWSSPTLWSYVRTRLR